MKARTTNPERYAEANRRIHRRACECRGDLDNCTVDDGQKAADNKKAAAA